MDQETPEPGIVLRFERVLPTAGQHSFDQCLGDSARPVHQGNSRTRTASLDR